MDDEREKQVEYLGTGFYIGWAVILLFALVLLILAVQNTQNVDVSFLGWDFAFPLFGVAIGAALAAVVLDELIGLVWRRRRRAMLAERAELRKLRDIAAVEPEPPAVDVPVDDRYSESLNGDDKPPPDPLEAV